MAHSICDGPLTKSSKIVLKYLIVGYVNPLKRITCQSDKNLNGTPYLLLCISVGESKSFESLLLFLLSEQMCG